MNGRLGILVIALVTLAQVTTVAHAQTKDPIVNCDFASSSYWTYCWPQAGYQQDTQAQIRPLEQGPYGLHDRLHLQPAGQESTDYFNFHIYFNGSGSLPTNPPTPTYVWRVYCSDSTSQHYCTQYNWNGNSGGTLFTVTQTSCLSANKWVCATYAAADFKDCITNTCPAAGVINADFPNLASLLFQLPGTSTGNIEDAFCDAMSTTDNINCARPR